MSDTYDTATGRASAWQQPTQSAGATDVVTQLQNIVRQLTAINKTLAGRVISGTFTMPAAATLTITQPAVQSLSTITLTPTNASAGTLQGSVKALYISAQVAGTSFTVKTANNTNAAGTETFSYTINTPT